LDTKIQVERFPAELRRQLRILAAVKGITLREAIIAATQAYVDGQASEPDK
jgi:hypothetical protein